MPDQPESPAPRNPPRNPWIELARVRAAPSPPKPGRKRRMKRKGEKLPAFLAWEALARHTLKDLQRLKGEFRRIQLAIHDPSNPPDAARLEALIREYNELAETRAEMERKVLEYVKKAGNAVKRADLDRIKAALKVVLAVVKNSPVGKKPKRR